MEKRCRTCDESKPLQEFHRDKSSPDGHRGECKACAYLRKKKWTEDNEEQYRAYLTEWNHDNAEMVREGNRQRYRKNRERYRDQARARYWEDPEKFRALSRAKYYRAKARKAEQ